MYADYSTVLKSNTVSVLVKPHSNNLIISIVTITFNYNFRTRLGKSMNQRVGMYKDILVIGCN